MGLVRVGVGVRVRVKVRERVRGVVRGAAWLGLGRDSYGAVACDEARLGPVEEVANPSPNPNTNPNPKARLGPVEEVGEGRQHVL